MSKENLKRGWLRPREMFQDLVRNRLLRKEEEQQELVINEPLRE
jgi:hypothetical protein